jgi:hypothetical protein
MKIIPEKNLSPFAYSALTLDNEFKELERLREHLERLNLETEKGLGSAPALLEQFGACGMRLAEGIEALAKTLDEARIRAEESSRIVRERANAVQGRQKLCNEIYGRYKTLGGKVAEISASIGQFRKAPGEVFSDQEKAAIPQYLSEVDQQIEILITEAEQLKQQASEYRLESLVRDVHAMGQSLGSIRRKLVSRTSTSQAQG